MPDTPAAVPQDVQIPRVRKMGFAFDAVPRLWFYDAAFVTHTANALNLLFPAGERFFVRSVKHYLPQITNPVLRKRVRAFFGQEGSHGHEHEHAFEILEAQGFEIREWLAWYERVAFELIEKRAPPVLRLSVTVALEHLTATLAEVALTEDFMNHAHPQMQALLRWHACEEIEHKSVAFDVLAEVDPRWWIRVSGMVVGWVVLMAFWRSATKMLLAQETDYPKAKLHEERRQARARGQDHRKLIRSVLGYLRPGFHPDQHDNYPLAKAYLEQIGRLDG